MRDLVYFVAVSVDGFIADPDGGFAAFPQDPATLAELFEMYPETCPAHLRELLGVTGQPRRFDTVVTGARTHQPTLDAGLTSAYPHLRQYVVTHRRLPDDPSVRRIDGDIAETVAGLKQEDGLDIWLCGGADIAAQLIDLVDEIQIKINPVVLGAGTPMTRLGYGPRNLALADTRRLAGEVLLNTYRRRS